MKKIYCKETVYSGQVISSNKENITILLTKDRTNDTDMNERMYISKCKYNKSIDFKKGDKCVVLKYLFDIDTYDDFEIACFGVIDMTKYDTAVRDSQKLPDGWIHTPYLKEIEEYGSFVEINDKIISYLPDNKDEGIKTINTALCKDISTHIKGNRFVILTSTFVYPNDEQTINTSVILDEDEYLVYKSSAKKINSTGGKKI